jgi:sugar-specific transcriptional regulator TrmB
MNINEILQDIGLSDKESSVYIALLRVGSAKVVQIAHSAELQRTTTYDILHTLSRKGLVTKYTKGASVIYTATDPRALTSFLDHQAKQFETQIGAKKQRVVEMLPELISLAKDNAKFPKVRFFEGAQGMREALEDTLNTREIILAYADIGSIYEEGGGFFSDYLSERIKRKIHAYAIAPDTTVWRETAQRSQKEMRTVRFLPEGAQYTPEVNIYDDKMLMISWKEKIAVIIESRDLAQLQKVIYLQLWNSLPVTKI